MKALIDTNVVLDVILSREPNRKDSEQIIEAMCKKLFIGYISASSVTDIYYIVQKRLGKKTAKSSIMHLLNIFSIIDVTKTDCINALKLNIDDFEDALVIVCSNKEHIDYVVTNDVDFLSLINQHIKIIKPDQFLKLI